MRLVILALGSTLAAGCATIGDPGGGSNQPTPIDTTGCTTVDNVPGDVAISSMDDLTGVPAGCWTLEGKLSIFGPAVDSLTALGDLRGVHDLEITYTSLTRIDTPNPLQVTGAIVISHDQQLTDLSNLAPQGTVTTVMIEDDGALTGLGGLAKLTAVTGDMHVDQDPKLAEVDLSALTQVGGALGIHDDAGVTRIALPALTTVGDVMSMNDAVLTSLDSMGALQAVHGSLMVGQNALLTGLGSFGTAARIDNNVVILSNPQLTGLGQLSHAGGIGGAIEIAGNSHLDYCAAAEVGCCVDAASVQIFNNLSSSCDGASLWCWSEQHGCPYGN